MGRWCRAPSGLFLARAIAAVVQVRQELPHRALVSGLFFDDRHRAGGAGLRGAVTIGLGLRAAQQIREPRVLSSAAFLGASLDVRHVAHQGVDVLLHGRAMLGLDARERLVAARGARLVGVRRDRALEVVQVVAEILEVSGDGAVARSARGDGRA